MELPKLDGGRIAAGAVIVVAVLIVGAVGWAFVEQLTLAQELGGEIRDLEAMVATRETRHEELTATLAYVQSDEYVEEWAREERKMARPGEVVVIPLIGVGEPAAESTSGDQAPGEAVDLPDSRPFWVVWWEAFFGP